MQRRRSQPSSCANPAILFASIPVFPVPQSHVGVPETHLSFFSAHIPENCMQQNGAIDGGVTGTSDMFMVNVNVDKI